MNPRHDTPTTLRLAFSSGVKMPDTRAQCLDRIARKIDRLSRVDDKMLTRVEAVLDEKLAAAARRFDPQNTTED